MGKEEIKLLAFLLLVKSIGMQLKAYINKRNRIDKAEMHSNMDYERIIKNAEKLKKELNELREQQKDDVPYYARNSSISWQKHD